MGREATMEAMQRHALRWIAVDARDVARVEAGRSRSLPAVGSVARGVVRWRRRIEQRRLLALASRSLLVGVALACLAQLAVLALGQAETAAWLAPGRSAGVACLAFGLAHRTSDGAAARMLDRDLGLGARVITALELERAGGPDAGAGSLRALALSDGRVALSRSLAGGRARLAPRRIELVSLAALAALLAALVTLPSAGASHRAGGAVRGGGHPSTSGQRAGKPPTPHVGASLQGYRQQTVPLPALAQVTASSTRAGGAVSGHSPYGGGIANSSNGGSF